MSDRLPLSVVLVHYQDTERLVSLLRQLPSALSGIESEVIIVDNASGDESLAAEVARCLPTAQFIQNETNVGFGRGVNQGVAASRGEIIASLNPDVELRETFFQPMLDILRSQPRTAVVGPAVWQPNGRRQLTGHHRFPSLATVFVEYCLPLQIVLSRWLSRWHPHDESQAQHAQTHRTSHLTGVCLLVRCSAFVQSQGLDERFFLYLEETDWQLRLARQGWEIWYCAASQLTHYGSIAKRYAQASDAYLTSLLHYWKKWFGPAALPGLRFVLAIAALVSLASLVPALLVSLVLTTWQRRVRLYVRSQLKIIWWSLRPHRL